MQLEFVLRDDVGGEQATFLLTKEGIEYLLSILDEAETKLKQNIVLSISRPIYRTHGVELVRYVYHEPFTLQIRTGDRLPYRYPTIVKASDVYDLHLEAVTQPYARTTRRGDRCFMLLYVSHLLPGCKQYRTVSRCIGLVHRKTLNEWYEVYNLLEAGLLQADVSGACL